MRESNHCFPNQNKACVCINSQLYDRRALDTSAPLPLFNSLTHLSYLTSTSPRIREIMTQDGGLERLVRMLHDYCLSPTPPENPALIYGLTPPNSRPPQTGPILNPTLFDKHAAYRFSLAFQCVVNIGVRGSEHIRSRVVQAGTLDVVGCVLEAWLASKGFAVGPSSSATGLPRETREQRQARKAAQLEARQREELARQREEAAQLQRALQQTQQRLLRQDNRTLRPNEARYRDDDAMDISPSPSPSASSLIDRSSHNSTPGANSDTDMSTDASMATTPLGSGTPTGSVVIPNRDRSGTLIARGWENGNGTQHTTNPNVEGPRHRFRASHSTTSTATSTDTSRPETETEDDGEQEADVDMDRTSGSASTSLSPSPERHHRNLGRLSITRRPVGIVSNDPPNDPQAGGLDAHIIINQAGGPTEGGVTVGVVDGDDVEDGLVSLDTNDDFAMGAPPGAPGAIHDGTALTDAARRRTTAEAPDVTPRAGFIGLPGSAESVGTHRQPTPQITAPIAHQRTIRVRHNDAASTHGSSLGGRSNSNHYREVESGPYRDEDVLLGLQLLAYLSKYPHVRQAFYKPRVTFHPASVSYTGARILATPSAREKEKQKESGGFFRAFAPGGRGKERAGPSSASSSSQTIITAPSTSQIRQTNVFSLVERFTFKPSSTETELPNPPPRLPPEIQYWAGVIMRNACRKDDSRGGIRQCANMLCGRWESYPREFAKCRRCRKAKYCGKDCQSTAWSEGHRFWCSAKDADEELTGEIHVSNHAGDGSAVDVQMGASPPPTARRRERGESDMTTVRGSRPSAAASSMSTARAEGIVRDRTLQPRTGRPSRATEHEASPSGRRRGETIVPSSSGEVVPGRGQGGERSIDPLEPGPSRRGGASYRFPRNGNTEGDDMVLG